MTILSVEIIFSASFLVQAMRLGISIV
jgi:hypothetical protein